MSLIFNPDFGPSAVSTLTELAALNPPGGFVRVRDISFALYYWDKTSTATANSTSVIASDWFDDGRWLAVAQSDGIAIYAADYGVIGDNSTECYSALVECVADAQTAMATYGIPVEIVLPPGDIVVTVGSSDPIDFTSGYSLALSGSVNIVATPGIRGAGRYATRIRHQTAGKALFRWYTSAANVITEIPHISDFSVFGAGTSNADTVAFQIGGVSTTRSDPSGNGVWERLYVRDVGTAFRMDDCTGHSFRDIVLENFAYGFEHAYNIDNCDYLRIHFLGRVGTTNQGIALAASAGTWTPAFNTPGSSNGQRFTSCLFNWLTNGFVIQGSNSNYQISNGYVERCNKLMTLGIASDTTGAKNIVLEDTLFAISSGANGFTSAVIEVVGTGGAVDPHIILKRNRREDASHAQQWVLGASQAVGAGTGCLIWEDSNILGTSHANGSVTWADANITVPHSGQGNLNVGKSLLQYNANTPLGSNPMIEQRLRQGVAGRTYFKATPVDATNAQAGSHVAIENLDAAGASQIVALKGAIIPQGQNSVARPSASSTYRGMLWVTFGAGGVTDSVDICLKAAADTYSWRQIITGG